MRFDVVECEGMIVTIKNEYGWFRIKRIAGFFAGPDLPAINQFRIECPQLFAKVRRGLTIQRNIDPIHVCLKVRISDL